MATGFQVDCRLNISGPANLKPVVQAIQSQLNGIRANITPQVAPGASNAFRNLATDATRFNQTLGQTAAAAQAAGRSMGDIGISPRAASTIGSARREAERLSASAAGVGNAFSAANGRAADFGRSLGGITRRFGSFLVVVKAIDSVQRALGEGARSAVAFQHEMVRLGQVGGDSSAQLKGIATEIGNLSRSLGVSSAELASVATTLKQAGLAADDVRTAMSALAKTAVAPSFDDLTNTVEGSIAAMQQFGFQAKDLESVLGSINTVSAKFAVESSDIVTAIRKAGGAFRTATGDATSSRDAFNQFISLFTSVRQTTRESADEIATGLRTIFGRIQGNQVSGALKDLGADLRYTSEEARLYGEDLSGQFVGAYNAVKRLSDAVKGIPTTDPRFAEIVTQVGGYRQISRVIPLLKELSTTQKAYTVAQAGANSLTVDAAKSQESFQNRLKAVKEEFLDLARSVGNNSGLQQFLNTMLDLTKGAIHLTKAIEPLIPALAALGVARVARTAITSGGQAARSFIDAATNVPTVRPASRKRFAAGGVVPGVGRGDKVPVDLPVGSFVVRHDSAHRIGHGRLAAMAGGRRRFEGGGTVPALVEPGEYIFTPEDVRKIPGGYSTLRTMNVHGVIPGDNTVPEPQRKLAAKIGVAGGMRAMWRHRYEQGGTPRDSSRRRFASGGRARTRFATGGLARLARRAGIDREILPRVEITHLDRDLEGRDLNRILNAAGVLGGSKVRIRGLDEGRTISVRFHGARGEGTRDLHPGNDDLFHVRNEEFLAGKHGSGAATESYARQILYGGVRKIGLTAAGSVSDPDTTGYYVWPAKFGAQGNLPLSTYSELSGKGVLPPGVDPKGLRTVQQVLALPGGEDLWRRYGEGFEASIDPASKEVRRAIRKRLISGIRKGIFPQKFASGGQVHETPHGRVKTSPYGRVFNLDAFRANNVGQRVRLRRVEADPETGDLTPKARWYGLYRTARTYGNGRQDDLSRERIEKALGIRRHAGGGRVAGGGHKVGDLLKSAKDAVAGSATAAIYNYTQAADVIGPGAFAGMFAAEMAVTKGPGLLRKLGRRRYAEGGDVSAPKIRLQALARLILEHKRALHQAKPLRTRGPFEGNIKGVLSHVGIHRAPQSIATPEETEILHRAMAGLGIDPDAAISRPTGRAGSARKKDLTSRLDNLSELHPIVRTGFEAIESATSVRDVDEILKDFVHGKGEKNPGYLSILASENTPEGQRITARRAKELEEALNLKAEIRRGALSGGTAAEAEIPNFDQVGGERVSREDPLGAAIAAEKEAALAASLSAKNVPLISGRDTASFTAESEQSFSANPTRPVVLRSGLGSFRRRKADPSTPTVAGIAGSLNTPFWANLLASRPATAGESIVGPTPPATPPAEQATAKVAAQAPSLRGLDLSHLNLGSATAASRPSKSASGGSRKPPATPPVATGSEDEPPRSHGPTGAESVERSRKSPSIDQIQNRRVAARKRRKLRQAEFEFEPFDLDRDRDSRPLFANPLPRTAQGSLPLDERFVLESGGVGRKNIPFNPPERPGTVGQEERSKAAFSRSLATEQRPGGILPYADLPSTQDRIKARRRLLLRLRLNSSSPYIANETDLGAVSRGERNTNLLDEVSALRSLGGIARGGDVTRGQFRQISTLGRTLNPEQIISYVQGVRPDLLNALIAFNQSRGGSNDTLGKSIRRANDRGLLSRPGPAALNPVPKALMDAITAGEIPSPTPGPPATPGNHGEPSAVAPISPVFRGATSVDHARRALEDIRGYGGGSYDPKKFEDLRFSARVNKRHLGPRQAIDTYAFTGGAGVSGLFDYDNLAARAREQAVRKGDAAALDEQSLANVTDSEREGQKRLAAQRLLEKQLRASRPGLSDREIFEKSHNIVARASDQGTVDQILASRISKESRSHFSPQIASIDQRESRLGSGPKFDAARRALAEERLSVEKAVANYENNLLKNLTNPSQFRQQLASFFAQEERRKYNPQTRAGRKALSKLSIEERGAILDADKAHERSLEQADRAIGGNFRVGRNASGDITSVRDPNTPRRFRLTRGEGTLRERVVAGTNKFFGGNGLFAATLAAGYAPSILEAGFGTVEAPRGTRTQARNAQAVGGGLTGLSIGLGLATAIPGVGQVAALGRVLLTAAPAVVGFVAALRDADERIKRVDFERSLGRFEKAVEGVSSGRLSVDSGIGGINSGLTAALSEAGRQADVQSRGGLASQILGRRGLGGVADSVLTGAYNLGGSLLDRITGSGAAKPSSGLLFGTDEDEFREQARLRQQKFAEITQPHLAGLQQAGDHLARSIRIDNRDLVVNSSTSQAELDRRKDDRLAEFQDRGGRQLAQSIAYAQNVPVQDVLESFNKIILATNLDRKRLEDHAKAVNISYVQFQKFSLLSQAVEAASASLGKFRSQGDTIVSLFEGRPSAPQVGGFSSAVGRIGGPDRAGFASGLDFARATLGPTGSSLAGDLSRIDEAKRTLPNAIAGSAGSLDEETIAGDIGKALEALPREIRGPIDAAIQAMDPAELLRNSLHNPSKLADDIIQNAFGDIIEQFKDSLKGVEDSFNEFGDNLTRSSEIAARYGDTLDRASSARLSVSRAQSARQSFLTGQPDRLDLATLRRPFEDRQRRLAATAGDAFSPNSIGIRLSNVQEAAGRQRDIARAAGTNPSDRNDAIRRYTELTDEAGRLQKALEHLADTSAEVSAIQEKLAQVEREREGSLGLAEHLLTSSPRESRSFARNNILSGVAGQQGNFLGFNANQIRDVLAHLRTIGEARLPNGRTGNSQAEFLLSNSGALLGLPFPRLNRQKDALLGEQAKVEDRGLKALETLAENQKGLNDRFLGNLKDANAQFLSNLDALIKSIDVRRAEGEVASANATRSHASSVFGRASDLDSRFALGPEDNGIQRARDLLANTSDLEAVHREQRHLKTGEKVDPGQIFRGIFGDKLDLSGEASFMDIFGGSPLGKEALEKHQDTLFENSDSIGKGLGLPADAVRAGVIPKYLADLNEAARSGDIINPSEIFSGAVKRERGERARSLLGRENDATNAAAVAVYGESNEQTQSLVRKGAAQRTSIERALKGLDAIESLADASKLLADAEARLAAKYNSLAEAREGGVAGGDLAQAKSTGGALFRARGTDTVPAMLSPGEFIINSASARANRGILEDINRAHGPAYRAGGGEIPEHRPYRPVGFVRGYAGAVASGAAGLLNGSPASPDYDTNPLHVRAFVSGFGRAVKGGINSYLTGDPGYGPVDENLRRELTKQEFWARIGGIRRQTDDLLARQARQRREVRGLTVGGHKRFTDLFARQDAGLRGANDFIADLRGGEQYRRLRDNRSDIAAYLDEDRERFARKREETNASLARIDQFNRSRPVQTASHDVHPPRLPLGGVAASPRTAGGPRFGARSSIDNLLDAHFARNPAGNPDTVQGRIAINDFNRQARVAARKGLVERADVANSIRRNNLQTDIRSKIDDQDDALAAREEAQRANREDLSSSGFSIAGGNLPKSALTGKAGQLILARQIRARNLRGARASRLADTREFNSNIDERAADRRKSRQQASNDRFQARLAAITGGTPNLQAAGQSIAAAAGGIGVDTVPAVLAQGEYAVNAEAPRKNLSLLRSVNASRGRRPLRRAEGGPVGSPAQSPATANPGASITNDTAGVAKHLQGAFAEFRGPAERLAKSLDAFGGQAASFASASRSLAEAIKPLASAAQVLANLKIPESIKVETKSQVEVLLNGGQVLAAMKGDMAREVAAQVIAQLEPQVRKIIAEMPAR